MKRNPKINIDYVLVGMTLRLNGLLSWLVYQEAARSPLCSGLRHSVPCCFPIGPNRNIAQSIPIQALKLQIELLRQNEHIHRRPTRYQGVEWYFVLITLSSKLPPE